MNYRDVIDHPDNYDFTIPSLGERKLTSPILGRPFTDDSARILFACREEELRRCIANNPKCFPAFEEAGPREKIFHDPSWSRVAILTAGGLCPGLNDVIKGLVETLWFSYGVRNIFGIRYGYRGLNPAFKLSPVMLDADAVDTIHEDGGSILGSSRGNQPIDIMVDTLQRMNITTLFCIGGDGTLRGANAICGEIRRRGLEINVVGVPKTVDNDLGFVGQSFGFETAVAECHSIITAAHMEAKGAFNGIGLVKVMGRDSGFIAAHATLSNSVVNYCLIPEVDLILEGKDGLFTKLEKRLKGGKGHAVIVVAEGAGQNFFADLPEEKDASGNVKKHDIGELLRNAIPSYLKAHGVECNVRYFDPSYLIRSVPTRGNDAIFCYQLAENAVHAAMAGKTDMVIGKWGTHFVNVPISLAVLSRQKINPEGSLWQAVLSSTRQNMEGCGDSSDY